MWLFRNALNNINYSAFEGNVLRAKKVKTASNKNNKFNLKAISFNLSSLRLDLLGKDIFSYVRCVLKYEC